MAKPEITDKTELRLRKLPRKVVRYWCFRYRTAEEGGAAAHGGPAGLKAFMEGREGFTSWGQFGVTWDVRDWEPLVIKARSRSLEVEWNTEAMNSARPLPLKKEVEDEAPITPAGDDHRAG
jgi:hypothetical protein